MPWMAWRGLTDGDTGIEGVWRGDFRHFATSLFTAIFYIVVPDGSVRGNMFA